MRGALKQAREVSAGLGEREQAEEGPGKVFSCFRKSLPHARGWKFAPVMRTAGRPLGWGSVRERRVCLALKRFLRK